MNTQALKARGSFHLQAIFQRISTSSLIITAIAISLLINLGGFPLFDLDEGAFSSATMEMLQRGDFITTYMGGQLRFDKPILIYWLQAASVYMLGLNEFALRLPSVICSIGWILAIYSFTKSYFNNSIANTAIVLTACSLVFSVIARAATADALLNLCLCLALFNAYKFFAEEEKQAPYLWFAYIWVGLAVLTKGPVGIFIPLVTMTAYSLFTRSWVKWRELFFFFPGWVICLAIFLPWYMAEYVAQGQAFIDGFFLKHNLSRFSSTMEGHGGHWYYYILISLLVFMPASGLFIVLFRTLNYHSIHKFDLWCWCWFFCVFLLFSFSKTQLPHYLLYGATPIFILMAKHRSSIRNPFTVFLPAGILLGLLFCLPWIAQHQINTSKNAYLVETLREGLQYLDWRFQVCVFTAIVAVIVVSFFSRMVMWQRQLGTSIIFSLVFTYLMIPTLANIQQQPVADIAELAGSLDRPIVMFHTNMPSFSVHLQKVVEIREPRTGELLFTESPQLTKYPGAVPLYTRGGLTLALIK